MKISGAVITDRCAAVAALFLFITLTLPAQTSWAQEKIKKPITRTPAAQPGPKPVEKKDAGPSPVQSAPASPDQAQSPPSSPAATLDFEMEMKKIEALIRVNDKNGEAYFNRACLYELKGDAQKAVEDYSKAIAINKGMKDALYNRALLFSRGKKYEEALKDFSEVIKLDPSALDALCNRGSIHFQTGKMDLAVADYSAGLKIAPRGCGPPLQPRPRLPGERREGGSGARPQEKRRPLPRPDKKGVPRALASALSRTEEGGPRGP